MNESARPPDDAFDAGIVPSLGVVPGSVAAAALLVPLSRGVDEPLLLAAAAFALATVAVFFARRVGALERRIGGPIAAGSSLVVVLLAGYALNQGLTGTATVPGVDWSVPLLFVAFFAAGGAVGIGVADYADVSARGLKRRLLRAAEMSALGFVGLLAMTIATILLATPLLIVVGDLSDVHWQLVQYVSSGVGLGAVAAGYLALRGHDLSFVDLEAPSLRAVLWTGGGLVALFGTLVGISFLMSIVGVETAEHGTVQQAERNPDLLLVIVPAMLLIVGPFEELLYRNVIQKTLYATFSRYGAVVVTSVIFATVHVAAYATAGPGQVLASLSMLFGLSLVLGTIYERTDNLVVPAIVHGCFNAVQMLTIYLW